MGEPTVLGMIHESLKRIEGDVSEVKSCMTSVKVEQAAAKEQRKTLFHGQNQLRKDQQDHMKKEGIHYDPKYEIETLPQKLKRKKAEVMVISLGGGSLGTIFYDLFFISIYLRYMQHVNELLCYTSFRIYIDRCWRHRAPKFKRRTRLCNITRLH